jgi:hypothetical protein
MNAGSHRLNVMLSIISMQSHARPFECRPMPSAVLLGLYGHLRRCDDVYLASKVRQRPTGDSACSWQMLAVVSADSMTLMPPATAVLDSCSSSPVFKARIFSLLQDFCSEC